MEKFILSPLATYDEIRHKMVQRSKEMFYLNLTPEDTLFLGCCLSEEVGEFNGQIKKLVRGFNNREKLKITKNLEKIHKGDPTLTMPPDSELEQIWENEKISKAASELADIFSYCILAAETLGVDLLPVVALKFNQVTKEMTTHE